MKTITIKKNPVITKNNNFKTILINVIFPYQEEVEILAKQAILPQMLLYMSKDYPTEGEFQKVLKENYILSYTAGKVTIGTTVYLNFELIIPDENSLKKDYIEKQIKFFSDAIYHPKEENSAFDSFEVNREKENLKLKINNYNKNFRSYLNYRITKLVDNKGVFSRSLQDNQHLIDEITPQNLYEFYKQVISNNKPICFVQGNIQKEKITSILKKYFPLEDNQKLNTNYLYYLKPFRDKPQIIEEEKEFKDSAIAFIYKVKNMKKEDDILLELLSNLLTSQSSNLLNKKLRDENNLVYSTNTIYYPNYGILRIIAYINPKNKKETEEKILEVMNNLKNKEIIAPLLEKIKDRKRINLIKKLDNKNLIFSENIYKALQIKHTSEKRYEKIKSITPEDIIKFIDRLQLDTIYFLKEKNNE